MPAPKRLSVLPFRTLECDSPSDHLRFGLPEAIAFALAPVQSLIARYGERPADFAVEGTVSCAGRFVRLNLELSGAKSHVFQTTPDDLFSLQDESVWWIVEALGLPLSPRERELLQRDVPACAEAYELYLRAQYRESVRADADYAPAWARLAEIENSPKLAREALDRALGLNPDLDSAHALYARIEVEGGEAGDAVARLVRRLPAASNSAAVLAALSLACRVSGMSAEAGRFASQARELDPEVSVPADTKPERLLQEALERLSAGEGFAAVLLLGDAVAKGFYPVEELETAGCFDILRDNPQFQHVVARAVAGRAMVVSAYHAGYGPELLAASMRQ